MRPTPTRRRATIAAAALALLVVSGLARSARAHLGSPDVFFEGHAGPYPLLVTVRPPEVIPGVALVEVQAPEDVPTLVTIVPTPMRGPGAAVPPAADVVPPSDDDPRRFSGQLWLMATGTWQVRVHVEGPRGTGDLAVPVLALPLRTKSMQRTLGWLLAVLLAFLVAGLINIVGASVRDADLATGQAVDPPRRRRGLLAQVVAAALLALLVAGGAFWWRAEDSTYRGWVYKPLTMGATLETGGGGRTLNLQLGDPGWIKARRLDDLVPDHDHLMHLFMVRVPALDVVAHLHPDQQTPGLFQRPLLALPPGDYQLFADIVHQTGLAETAVATLAIADGPGGEPQGDDTVGVEATTTAVAATAGADQRTRLADGTTVVWQGSGSGARLRAGQVTWFRFRVQDDAGNPAGDLVPYMGMAGHAAFIKDDRSVFAHIHPSGSVSMAALGLVQNPSGDAAAGAQAVAADPHAAHRRLAASALPAEIAFPYACPTPGRYRVVVQFKRGPRIHTAFFTATVD